MAASGCSTRSRRTGSTRRFAPWGSRRASCSSSTATAATGRRSPPGSLDVPERLDDAPFELLPVRRNRFWKEVALWWPERRLLACGDVLGTVPFFRAGGEPVGVHPLLRLRPPRALRGLGAEHVWLGHGEGLSGPETAAAVEDALAHARRRLPRWLAGLPRVLRRGY
jgi:hypothetical protein